MKSHRATVPATPISVACILQDTEMIDDMWSERMNYIEYQLKSIFFPSYQRYMEVMAEMASVSLCQR